MERGLFIEFLVAAVRLKTPGLKIQFSLSQIFTDMERGLFIEFPVTGVWRNTLEKSFAITLCCCAVLCSAMLFYAVFGCAAIVIVLHMLLCPPISSNLQPKAALWRNTLDVQLNWLLPNLCTNKTENLDPDAL